MHSDWKTSPKDTESAHTRAEVEVVEKKDVGEDATNIGADWMDVIMGWWDTFRFRTAPVNLEHKHILPHMAIEGVLTRQK